ncbi:hypothetical protein EJ04DRAFT_554062 [Polyplosphaeria fusca]|uniref:WW domain-containing protein n=1 Tax=Polyplosphaeria fusca TaxID=682080 RepID=A0A9P4UXS1_9PLEO|nr:hypothetical protein EJ04DRAFT_554062 [Polyplosphaeria fusca]
MALKFRLAILALSLILFIQSVASQSLPACGQTCVVSTKTRCKSTDYHCACKGDYISRLKGCVAKTCAPAEKSEAENYLNILCASVGIWISTSGGTAQERADLRRAIGVPEPIVERQLASFGPEVSFTASVPGSTTTSFLSTSTGGTTSTPSTTGTASSSSTSAATSGAGDTGGGLTTGAKVGLGVGIPGGVIIIALLVGAAFMFGRRSRKEKSQSGIADQPTMAQGPAELSPEGRPLGAELSTQANVTEMPGTVPAVKDKAGLPLRAGQGGYAGPPPPLPQGWASQWDQQHQTWYFVNHATGQSQWEVPAELPERSRTVREGAT